MTGYPHFWTLTFEDKTGRVPSVEYLSNVKSKDKAIRDAARVLSISKVFEKFANSNGEMKVLISFEPVRKNKQAK